MNGAEATKKRVLVVDWDEGRRITRGRRFADAQYEVVYAHHELEGFGLARRWLPDLVLLHGDFRGSSVTDLARRIAVDPRTRHAVIVVTSASGVVGAFRLHAQLAMKDVALVPYTDDFVRALVRGAEATP